jgi:hypothetical protein
MFLQYLKVALNPTIDFIAGTVAVRLSSLQMSILNNPSHRVSPVLLSASLLIQVHSKLFLFLIQSFNCTARTTTPTVKVRFQNPAVASKYHSTIHAITSIVREERFTGLYKGIMAPLVNVLFGFLERRRLKFMAGNSCVNEWIGFRIL